MSICSTLQHEARLPASGGHRGARAGVLVFGADRFEVDALAVEVHGIDRDGRGDDGVQIGADGIEGAGAATQEIEIERGPVRPIRPEPQQHRPFEHETVAEIGHGEPVQEAFQTVTGEQRLVVVAGLLRPVEQARGDGGAKIGLAAHAMASR